MALLIVFGVSSDPAIAQDLLQLEPNNSYIKQNYELFKEINDRTTRKDGQ